MRWCNKPIKRQLPSFLSQKMRFFSKRDESIEVDCRTLATCAQRDSFVLQQWQSPRSWNMKRDFNSNVYTILYSIPSKLWKICAFWVLNPRQTEWSLAKQCTCSLKCWKVMPQTCRNWANCNFRVQCQRIMLVYRELLTGRSTCIQRTREIQRRHTPY